ncbi:hypothetical protein [Candidatus Nitrosocosmicus sp. T]
MPIDQDFSKNHQPVSRNQHVDKEHYRFVWGPGRIDAESSINKKVQDAYKSREENYVALGIHGTMVAVARDSCIANRDSIEFRQYRCFNGIEKTILYVP